MANFPTLSSGASVMLPLVVETMHPTRALVFVDRSEQRFSVGKALRRFVLKFTGLNYTDALNVRNFFETSKGAFDGTWGLTIGGTTYTDCAFEQDECRVEETEPKQYSIALACRQRK